MGRASSTLPRRLPRCLPPTPATSCYPLQEAPLHAHALVCTLPLGCLQRSTVRFDPPLPGACCMGAWCSVCSSPPSSVTAFHLAAAPCACTLAARSSHLHCLLANPTAAGVSFSSLLGTQSTWGMMQGWACGVPGPSCRQRAPPCQPALAPHCGTAGYKQDAIQGLGMGTENRVAMLFDEVTPVNVQHVAAWLSQTWFFHPHPPPLPPSHSPTHTPLVGRCSGRPTPTSFGLSRGATLTSTCTPWGWTRCCARGCAPR